MKKILALAACILCSVLLFSQTTAFPFQKDIDAFKKKDSLQPPAKNQILFVGSSSFTKWVDVQDYFPGYPILNRGFGGSSLPDVIRYANDIIFPYQPKQIIIYCGENDVAASDTITAEIVLARVKQLFYLIRTKLKNTPVVFISLKPSPSRWKFEPVIVKANQLIEQFLKKQKKAQFIDVYNAMLNEKGMPKEDIFLADQLHMNAKGYAIWQPIIKAALIK